MATKNLKPIRTKSQAEIYANTEGLRNSNTPKHIKPEIAYAGTITFVPELNMRIKIRPGSTVKEWIIKYALNNPLKKGILYPKYKVTKEDELEFESSKKLIHG